MTACSGGFVFDFLLDSPGESQGSLLIVDLIDEQLEWMVVEVSKLDVSVSLVCELSFSTILDEVSWSLRPEWNSIVVSESNEEHLLELSVAVEVLLEVS